MGNNYYKMAIAPRCEYCQYGTSLGQGEIACLKRGFSTSDARCARFKYDPIKRVPEVRAKLKETTYTKADFEL